MYDHYYYLFYSLNYHTNCTPHHHHTSYVISLLLFISSMIVPWMIVPQQFCAYFGWIRGRYTPCAYAPHRFEMSWLGSIQSPKSTRARACLWRVRFDCAMFGITRTTERSIFGQLPSATILPLIFCLKVFNRIHHNSLLIYWEDINNRRVNYIYSHIVHEKTDSGVENVGRNERIENKQTLSSVVTHT